MISAISDMLIFPICRGTFDLTDAHLICKHGHTFDVSAKGYVNLSSPVGRKQIDVDTADMVAARLRVLESGLYDPLVTALVTAASTGGGTRIADFGSGPGYYLESIITAVPGARGVAVDVSQAAVRSAGRRHPMIGAVRANLRTLVPLKDGGVDIGLNILAPHSTGEMARILAPEGVLLVVIPGKSHLKELRSAGLVLGMENEKSRKIKALLEPSFRLEDVKPITWAMPADPAIIADIAAMGPSAFHETHASPVIKGSITGDVELQIWRSRKMTDDTVR